jgi:hypothetical protein
MLIRIDLIFSYWIVAWYLAYIAKLTSFNPKWALILGITENILIVIALLFYSAAIRSIAMFILVNFIIKGIPLYTIYGTKATVRDIYAIFVLFVIHAIWVHVNGETVIGYSRKIFDSILHDKAKTPGMWLVEKIRTDLSNTK